MHDAVFQGVLYEDAEVGREDPCPLELVRDQPPAELHRVQRVADDVGQDVQIINGGTPDHDVASGIGHEIALGVDQPPGDDAGGITRRTR